MKTNTRYMITAGGVAVGLFAIGATANALTTDDTAASNPIGSGVVLPVSSTSSTPSPSATPSVIAVEYAEPSDSTDPTNVPPAISTGGWATGPATAVGDDDGSEHEGHDGHESDD